MNLIVELLSRSVSQGRLLLSIAVPRNASNQWASKCACSVTVIPACPSVLLEVVSFQISLIVFPLRVPMQLFVFFHVN